MALVPITRDAMVSCVSLHDNAIDWENSVLADKEAVARYKVASKIPPKLQYQIDQGRRPSSWRDLLVFKDGAQPTEFLLGVVPSATLARIEDECRLGKPDERTREFCWRSFLHGVRDIRGAFDVVQKKLVDGVEYVDSEWLAQKFVGHLREIALEMGSVIWQWNQLPPETAKN